MSGARPVAGIGRRRPPVLEAPARWHSRTYPGSIPSVKLSVSLSEEDVALLDEHARISGLRSRSAVLRQAIRLLSRTNLDQDYAAAWEAWELSGERDAWEAVTGDGMP